MGPFASLVPGFVRIPGPVSISMEKEKIVTYLSGIDLFRGLKVTSWTA